MDSPSTVSGYGQTDAGLRDALSFLLKPNPPDGGVLGFGLAHKCPFNSTSTDLKTIGESLKGTDAAVKRVCDSHTLPVAVKAIYRDCWRDGAVLQVHFADLGDEQIELSLVYYLGQIIYNFGERPEFEDSQTATPLVWVKPFTSPYMHY